MPVRWSHIVVIASVMLLVSGFFAWLDLTRSNDSSQTTSAPAEPTNDPSAEPSPDGQAKTKTNPKTKSGGQTAREQAEAQKIAQSRSIKGSQVRKAPKATESDVKKSQVPVEVRFDYRIETRGKVTADLAQFRRQARETLADARGWRGAGVAFREVKTGGDFTLWLATAEQLPSFGGVCHVNWSCRNGRDVIINEQRWLGASDAWRASGGSIRDYRHMVVNHEVGHWLGQGHSSCEGGGKKAPVMMQQSKDLAGCVFNPWPLPRERKAVS